MNIYIIIGCALLAAAIFFAIRRYRDRKPITPEELERLRRESGDKDLMQ